jgi:hypothetical protein
LTMLVKVFIAQVCGRLRSNISWNKEFCSDSEGTFHDNSVQLQRKLHQMSNIQSSFSLQVQLELCPKVHARQILSCQMTNLNVEELKPKNILNFCRTMKLFYNADLNSSFLFKIPFPKPTCVDSFLIRAFESHDDQKCLQFWRGSSTSWRDLQSSIPCYRSYLVALML